MTHPTLPAALRRHLSTRWCPHTPHPKQAEFLALDCREALYGGAAGGGKSDALLMAALQHVDVPGYSAIVFRKTYADLALPGAIMDRAHTWLAPTRAHWDGVNKTWRFPSGARIRFGYLQTARDRYNYQGAEFQFIAFDELTQFEARDYLYLFSRLRSPSGMTVPLRMRAASNPGGTGHDWVHERFVASSDPSRRFVPALMQDNPSLDAAQYRASLSELDSVTRRQLEDGVWEQDTSGLVYSVYQENIWRGEFARDGEWTYGVGHDYGVTNNNAITVAGWKKHSRQVHLFRSFYVKGLSDDMAREHRAVERDFDVSKIVGDIGGLGKAFAGELITRHNLPVEQAEKTNKLGYIKLFNGALERREIVIHEEGCADLLAEYPKLVRKTDGSEAGGAPNHCADSALYIWRWCRAFHEVDAPEMPSHHQALAQWQDRVIEQLERSLKKEWWEQ